MPNWLRYALYVVMGAGLIIFVLYDRWMGPVEVAACLVLALFMGLLCIAERIGELTDVLRRP